MKILSEILKENSKYSIKRIFALITFIVSMFIGIFIVISDLYLDTKTINSQAKDVLDSFLLFTGILIGVAEVSKKIINKTDSSV